MFDPWNENQRSNRECRCYEIEPWNEPQRRNRQCKSYENEPWNANQSLNKKYREDMIIYYLYYDEIDGAKKKLNLMHA